MAEKTFRSPGFFEQEIDLSERKVGISGTPAGIIGTAERGPAFVPVTLGSWGDFEQRFGSLDPDQFGPYAVREWLKNRTAVTYMRVLGAGANDTSANISTTNELGTVTYAGFKLVSQLAGSAVAPSGGAGSRGWRAGATQFLCAKHFLSSSGPAEMYGFPVFSDNDSFQERNNSGEADVVNLVRAVIMTTTGSRVMIADGTDGSLKGNYATAANKLQLGLDDFAGVGTWGSEPDASKTFKLVLSSSSGTAFGKDDNIPGVRVLTASLDPDHVSYIAKILNTDPAKFQKEEHLLYLDYQIENELASVVQNDAFGIAICSGSTQQGSTGGSGGAFNDLFGKFNTRYTTPRTTWMISQPFGNKEYDLFHFETISDGAVANADFKISIANIRASTDPTNLYGTFEVQVRRFGDTDIEPEIIERYPDCSLDPNSDGYIARLIGDKKVSFDWDADNEDERRLVIQGKYPNKSALIRVRMHALVDEGDTPTEALPFGFRGVPVLKTNDSLTDVQTVILKDAEGNQIGKNVGTPTAELDANPAGVNRLVASGAFTTSGGTQAATTGSIVPPLPYRFKVTKGRVRAPGTTLDGTGAPAWLGEPGKSEKTDSRYYWGVKFTRLAISSSATPNGLSFSVLNSNASRQANPLVNAYTKFQGIYKLDTVVTGTGKDLFNNNKFSLSKVALYNTLDGSKHITDITGTAKEHMKQAAYIRNGVVSSDDYTIQDPIASELRSGGGARRITLATLLNTSSVVFNRFQDYAKFSTIFYGGFDGLNILDKNNFEMTDRASSSDARGYAAATIAGGLGLNGTDDGTMTGTGKNNNIVFAYRTATKMMTDEMTVNTNLLAIPGIRDSFITDFAAKGTKENAMIMYTMDVPYYGYDDAGTNVIRLYDDRAAETRPDVRETAEALESRVVDNNYSATYFPDVIITDEVNNENVMVPSSVAALSAIGFNDKVGYPWFAPAGFNRAALGIVSGVDVRLTAGDRDELYDARINPIAIFPNGGASPTYVIFGQKTLQMAKSALDRVNVRRLLLEVKRQVVAVANRMLFEPNNAASRARFVGLITPLLALIQSQAGIESFQVVVDESNNTPEDMENNKLNGRIVLVPTRAVEFISIDFIITNSGVSFE